MGKKEKLKKAAKDGVIERDEIIDIMQENDINEDEYSLIADEFTEKGVRVLDNQEELKNFENESDIEEEDEVDEYYDSELLKSYLNEINNYPILSEKEERELAEKAVVGDTVSKEKLITSNLRLVAGIALKYSKKSLQYMDLIQDGTIGLIKAIDKFDPSKGYRLNTYATWWIKREIIEAIKEKINMIKVPGYIFLIYKKMEKIAEKIEKETGKKPKIEELALAVEISTEEAENIMRMVKAKVQGLDQEDSDGEKFEFEIRDNTTEEEIDKMIESMNSRLRISKMIDILDSREKKILSMYFGLNEKGENYTFKEIGHELEISAERVRVIKEKALRKLRNVEGYKWW